MTNHSLSDTELGLVVDELAPVVNGSRIGKCHVRDAWTVSLECDTPRLDDRRRGLLLSTHPSAARLHFEDHRRKAPPRPAAFAMLLRKHLSGVRVQELVVPREGERIVELRLGTSRPAVVAELTGAHGNVFLVGPEGTLLGALRPPGRGMSVGAPYAAPEAAPAGAPWRGRQRFRPPDVAAQVAVTLEKALHDERLLELRSQASRLLARDIARLTRRLSHLADDLARVDESQSFRRWGDLLLAQLTTLEASGQRWIDVPDLFDTGDPVRIPVDPALTLRRNAERYYHQHRRLNAKRELITDRIRDTRQLLEDKRATALSLDALGIRQLERLVPIRPSGRGAPKQAPSPRLPFREYRGHGGATIRVGRGARDNDKLTFGHARGNDLWLHCRDAPGSHVILRLPKREPPTQQALLDAATLAAHFSPLASESQVDVQYTHVKHLRKPKGAPPGLVTLAGGKTIRVRIEPPRLDRLLKTTQ